MNGIFYSSWSISFSLLGERSVGNVLDVRCGNSAKDREILTALQQENSLINPSRGRRFCLIGNSPYSMLEQLLEQQDPGSVSVYKRQAWQMLNWHSFIGIHFGYFSYFSPGKTSLVAALSWIQSYFRHLHILLRGKQVRFESKVDIAVIALTKDILIFLP